MNVPELQNDKLSIINWITQLQDHSLIEKIKELMADNKQLSKEVKQMLDKRLKEDKSTYTPARESLNKIRSKYEL